MRRLLILSLALMAFASSLAAQSKHLFTFEDMIKLKRVGDPQISPDGKWIIFSVVDVDLAANTKTPHIWIVRVGADEQLPEHTHRGHVHLQMRVTPLFVRLVADRVIDPSCVLGGTSGRH